MCQPYRVGSKVDWESFSMLDSPCRDTKLFFKIVGYIGSLTTDWLPSWTNPATLKWNLVQFAEISFFRFFIIISFSKNENVPKYQCYRKSIELVIRFTIRQRQPAIMEQPTPKHQKVWFSQRSQGKISGIIRFTRVPPDTQCTHWISTKPPPNRSIT